MMGRQFQESPLFRLSASPLPPQPDTQQEPQEWWLRGKEALIHLITKDQTKASLFLEILPGPARPGPADGPAWGLALGSQARPASKLPPTAARLLPQSQPLIS